MQHHVAIPFRAPPWDAHGVNASRSLFWTPAHRASPWDAAVAFGLRMVSDMPLFGALGGREGESPRAPVWRRVVVSKTSMRSSLGIWARVRAFVFIV